MLSRLEIILSEGMWIGTSLIAMWWMLEWRRALAG